MSPYSDYDPIHDSSPPPASKRQKTPNGYIITSSPNDGLISPILNTFVTQPTQLLPKVPTNVSEILVPDTSPVKHAPQRSVVRNFNNGHLTESQRGVVNRMAPPGTYFNAAPQYPNVNTNRTPIPEDSDNEKDIITDSDEDVPPNRHDIPSAKIKPAQSPALSRGASSLSGGGSFISNKWNLGSLQKTGTSSGTQPLTEDIRMIKALKEVKAILPAVSEAAIKTALRRKGYNPTDAIDLLMGGIGGSDTKRETADVARPKGVASTFTNPSFKRQSFHARDNKQSIAQKHGIFKTSQSQFSRPQVQLQGQSQTQSQTQSQSQSEIPDSPVVPRRRLVPKVKKPDPSPESDDDVIEISAPASKPHRKRLMPGRRSPTPEIEEIAAFVKPKQKIQLARDLSDDSDASDVEELQGEAENENLLHFFNTCDVKQLADLATTSEEDAAYIIEKRPFGSLDDIRAIQSEQEPPKTAKGRVPRRKPIGDKLVDATEKMWRGLEAVDVLVKECNALNDRVKGGLERLGIRVRNNELDVSKVEIESRADSGLGTPTMTSSAKYLSKPAIMSNDLELKSHQVIGLNWLNLLHTEGISAILADDMGLGKTCQVIAFLSHLAEQGDMGRHLIIVPGSTLENWMREFSRFSPSLAVYPYHGSQSERLSMQQDILEGQYDAILTTYDMATKKDDNKFFRKLEPKTVVFDEGHMLKNKTSNRFQQLIRIKTPWRLLLTGTPLQNNLLELISIINFMMPELFKDQSGDMDVIFKHKAKTTDSEHSALLSAQRVQRARQMMAPFILRRKKEDVDSALPPKTRRIEYCDMVERQNSVYKDYTEIHQEALRNRSEGIVSIPQNYLMDRRKAAIHPLLFRYLYTNEDIEKMHKKVPRERGIYKGWSAIKMKEEMEWWSDFKIHQLCLDTPSLNKYALAEEDWMESGKVSKVLELLKQFDKEGSRALLFSQFTMVMDILEAVFNSVGIKFCRLDGNTPIAARQDWIDTFHQDESYKVFMLSTRSGGTGINLACANKVIIFDASFNPQDDMQAENRAHRFGQTREVEVIRLISRHTVEEQIHTLCEGKLALEGAVTGEDLEKKNIEMVQKMLAEEAAPSVSIDKANGANKKKETNLQVSDEDVPSEREASTSLERCLESKAKTSKTKKENIKGRKQPDIRDAFTKSLKDAGVNVVKRS